MLSDGNTAVHGRSDTYLMTIQRIRLPDGLGRSIGWVLAVPRSQDG